MRRRVLLEGQALKKGKKVVKIQGELHMAYSSERISEPEAYQKAVQDLAAYEDRNHGHVELDTRFKLLQMSMAYFAHALEYGSQGKRKEFQYCLRKYLEATLTPGVELDDNDGRRRNIELRKMRRECRSWDDFSKKVKAYVVAELRGLQSLKVQPSQI